MGWSAVGFVFTGSSVPGFSQNPCKGKHLVPSKITSTSKSDVDICIKADGVPAFVEQCHANNVSMKGFPTTCSPTSGGMRFGLKDLGAACPELLTFYLEWSEKLPGGLQLTMCEDDLDIPPWEARIDMSTT